MNSKKQWIRETMESLDGIHRAESDPLVFHKVTDQFRNPLKITPAREHRQLWQIAAGLALLVTLNVFSLVFYTRFTAASQNTEKIIASEYLSYLDTIQF